MRKKLLFLLVLSLMTLTTMAQRFTDKLDRGLVAMKTTSGVYCSWRILADEYYDVTYNIYRGDTKLNATPLTTSNYTDAGGTSSSEYRVEAIFRGVSEGKSAAVTPWANNYLQINMDHGSLTSTFVPNDAEVADIDGDGQVEVIIKFDNSSDAASSYMPGGYNGEYTVIEAYKLNGKKLWWINCGPNMTDFQNNETNIIAYDWDEDGKAECVLRGADGMVIHMADGTTQTIGDSTKNYRATGGSSGQFFVHEGSEFLIYMNGETGKPYQVLTYPLKRLEDGETDLEKAWGDGYGHRSTKHFFGAPYLDGKKPSIFLARGIYTRHKMIAYDVDPATHSLNVRWTWNCNNSSSPWYGEGYHNYGIADVDWDGRDEIVYGSMVIDDNGHGLSTTGLGHGDAQHCGDFNPYIHGQEIFNCNETQPINNYRDATTSKIYYRTTGSNDAGRAIAGNFSDDYPGAIGLSAYDSPISLVKNGHIDGMPSTGITENFRIYWDGDLNEESMDYTNGKNTAVGIYKYNKGLIETLDGSLTNNDTKGTPCFQGDILGDWREEIIARTADNNVRIYSTTKETPWRNYSLWYDHQYRNGMVWQMCGYNQPPHVSYFLGRLEGMTVAPPPLTTTGRTEVSGSITSATNDKHIMLSTSDNTTVNVEDGASPYIFTDNAPSWVQGTDVNGTSGKNPTINYVYYTHTLTGGAFTGAMRLVKQGDGILALPKVTETYKGSTDVWAGTLAFDGIMQNSRVWLNRFAELNSNGGNFQKGIQADYASIIRPGGKANLGTLTTDSLILNFGSRVVFDINSANHTSDTIHANVLKIEKKVWVNGNGPTYSTPVFEINELSSSPSSGKFLLCAASAIVGSLDNIVIEGLNGAKATLSNENGKIYMTVLEERDADITWDGGTTGVWDNSTTSNFLLNGASDVFMKGDRVTFDDNATNPAVTISGNLAPASLLFNNSTKAYTLDGDSLIGNPALTKNGTASVTINNQNHLGNTVINGGTLTVGSFANAIGTDCGSLGDINKSITICNGATLSTNVSSATCGQSVYIGASDGQISVPTNATLTMAKAILANGGTTLTKTGNGTLTLGSGNTISKLIVASGTVNSVEASGLVQLPSTVELQNATLWDPGSEGSYTTNASSFVIADGKTAYIYAKPRCEYTGAVSGAGKLYLYATGIRGYYKGDWTHFTGTLVPGYKKRGSYDPSFDFTSSTGLPNATLLLNSGITFNATNTIEIGTVSGSGILAGSGKYILGNNDKDVFLNASATAPIIKRGTGTMRLTTAGNITGGVTVEEGSLFFNDTQLSTAFFGTNTVQATGTSKIVGRGLITTMIMNDGTTLEARSMYSESTPGVLKTNASLSMLKGSTLVMVVKSNSSYSQLQPTFFTMNGTLKLTLTSDYVPAVGDTFTLWTVTRSFSGTPIYDLPTLPDGMYWDVSGLAAATGVLKITNDPAAGIGNLSADTEVDCEVFTLGGSKVATLTTEKGKVAQAVRNQGLNAGTYLVKMRGSNHVEMQKVLVR